MCKAFITLRASDNTKLEPFYNVKLSTGGKVPYIVGNGETLYITDADATELLGDKSKYFIISVMNKYNIEKALRK